MTIRHQINGHVVDQEVNDKFLIEVGHGKGSYKVRYAVLSAGQAIRLYDAINIGRGYKKRLRLNRQVLARNLS